HGPLARQRERQPLHGRGFRDRLPAAAPARRVRFRARVPRGQRAEQRGVERVRLGRGARPVSAYPNHRRDCAYVVSTGPAPCTCDYYDRPECEHDWELVPDWYGDPNVINGTRDCSYKRCRKCGEEPDLE